LAASPLEWRYAISPVRLSSDDPLLRHKTNWRGVHDGELARLGAQTGCAEVLFLNEQDELCEGSRSNLFVEIDGMLLTPAQPCGLLDGCLRQDLLTQGQCREAVLKLSDLDRAARIYFGNSLRGLIRAMPVTCAGSP
ncbi:MAG: aminotransferase class IV, partial [Rhodanobacter sp.]